MASVNSAIYRPGDTNELGQAINMDGSLYTGNNAMTRDQYQTQQNQQKQSQLYVNYNNQGGVTDQAGYDQYMAGERAAGAAARGGNPYANGAANAFAAPGSAAAPADPLAGYSPEMRSQLESAIGEAAAAKQKLPGSAAPAATPQGRPTVALPAPAGGMIPAPADPTPAGYPSVNKLAFDSGTSSSAYKAPSAAMTADQARQYIAKYDDLRAGFADRANSPAEWGLQNASEEEWANRHFKDHGAAEQRTWMPDASAPPPAPPPTPGTPPAAPVPAPPPAIPGGNPEPLTGAAGGYFSKVPGLADFYTQYNTQNPGALTPEQFAAVHSLKFGDGSFRLPGFSLPTLQYFYDNPDVAKYWNAMSQQERDSYGTADQYAKRHSDEHAELEQRTPWGGGGGVEAGTGFGAQAATAKLSGLNDPNRWEVTRDQTVQGRMADLLDPNDPYNQAAQALAQQQAGASGMQNSSMAASLGTKAIIDSAREIAAADAATTSKAAGYNADQLNQNNQLRYTQGNQMSLANAQNRNQVGLSLAQLASSERTAAMNDTTQRWVTQKNAESAQAIAKLNNDAQAALNSEKNKHDTILQTSSAAANAYNSYANALLNIQMNDRMDENAKQTAIKNARNAYEFAMSAAYKLSGAGLPDFANQLWFGEEEKDKDGKPIKRPNGASPPPPAAAPPGSVNSFIDYTGAGA